MINRAATARKPFFLEIATFAPHGPVHAGAAGRDEFPGLKAPRTPAFNEVDMRDKPPLAEDPR